MWSKTRNALTVLLGLAFAGIVWGGESRPPASETREGYLMPELCKSRTASGPAEHETECALEPECVASGFGLYVANRENRENREAGEYRFLPFDDAGDALALSYFRSTKRTSGHRVSVTGGFDGDEVRVREILPVDAE